MKIKVLATYILAVFIVIRVDPLTARAQMEQFLLFLSRMTVIARILTIILCVTLLIGCAGQALQLPLSTNDPANPNAPEAAFSPRPNWLQAEVPVTTEQPPTEPTSSTHLPPTIVPTMYTCPMHPEEVQSSPGRCLKCGMRLVPTEPPKIDEEGKQ